MKLLGIKHGPKGTRLAASRSRNGGYLPLLCTINLTVAGEQIRKLFNLDVTEFNDLASKAPRGSKGLLLHPYRNGEKIPKLS